MQGEEWKKTTLQTAMLFPGVCFGIFFVLNMLVWGQKSSGAVPWTTLFALCFLWFGISVSLLPIPPSHWLAAHAVCPLLPLVLASQ